MRQSPFPFRPKLPLRLSLPLAPLALALASAACAGAPVTTAEPKPLPDLRFEDLAGNPASLGDFRGQVVVLNLWATWCAPCREEMPSLDRLQALFDGEPVRVVALSVDRAAPERVKNFIDEVGATRLAVYRDPAAAAARTLKVPGLPATLIVDREGREVGRILGTAEWDGAAAVAAIRRVLGAGTAGAPIDAPAGGAAGVAPGPALPPEGGTARAANP